MDYPPYQHPFFKNTLLTENGLNLHAVFNIDQLPIDVYTPLPGLQPDLTNYRQLILIGHGGRTLWQAIKQSRLNSTNPVDDFTTETIKLIFADQLSNHHYQILYPGAQTIGLQALGTLAGWHHSSPMMLGINHEWGTWFAYRAVVLADTQLETTIAIHSDSPCDSCSDKPCISHCAAAALSKGILDFNICAGYRKRAASQCNNTCLSRISCPVASEHRYSEEQIQYHYSRSLQTIEQYY